ncbi:MAG TPA: hypothetical protein VFU93_12685 [Acidimicrobiales bacterium]|nr:hypothetical protein [Acidimicrobiales bacterium]
MVRTRRRLVRRLVTLGAIGGLLAYRRQRLDAADRAFPEAQQRSA